MAFDWSNVGQAPAADEFEITVFGPGFGECIVMHVGSGRWLIVDSCVDTSDPDNKHPLAERYLRAICVDPATQVDMIVATHWHDDHVRGLSRLTSVCASAQFVCANAMVQREFQQYVQRLATGSAATNGAKITEFRQVMDQMGSRDKQVMFATNAKQLRVWPGPKRMLTALSPSDREFELFLKEVAALMPQHGQPKKAAQRPDPNMSAIVLHLNMGEFSILLGADMETHHDAERGWNAVVDVHVRLDLAQSILFKVSHHGSENGHHDQQWTNLLHPLPIGVVTPYTRLREGSKLPTEEDLKRLLGLTSVLYLTSDQATSGQQNREATVQKSLKESAIKIRNIAVPIGMVRLRRPISGANSTWEPLLIKPARAHNHRRRIS